MSFTDDGEARRTHWTIRGTQQSSLFLENVPAGMDAEEIKLLFLEECCIVVEGYRLLQEITEDR